jgi:hypothetical protein
MYLYELKYIQSLLEELIFNEPDCPNSLYFTSEYLKHFFPTKKDAILKYLYEHEIYCDCELRFAKVSHLSFKTYKTEHKIAV